MNLKTKIKNDLWQVNYIIPFTAKYLQKGKGNYIKKSLPVITKTRVVKGTKARDVSADIKALMEKTELCALPDSSFFYWLDVYKTIAVKGQVISNFTLDYDKVVNGVFEKYADKAAAVGGVYGQRAENIREAIFVLRRRIRRVIAEQYPKGTDRARLLKEFSVMLEQPAEHFHEGLQRILFFNQYLWQTRHRLNGLGRLDKILGSLYEKDLKNGIVTRESAYEMILDFLKVLHRWYAYKSAALLGDIGQIIVLGGLAEDGNYFCNELTSMFIEAQAEMRQPDPKVLLRVSKKMPEELLKKAVQALNAKTGSPLFSNDDVVIPQLIQFGISEKDAYSYCVSACWEPYIPGKSLDQNNVMAFDFFRPLDMCLNAIAKSEETKWPDTFEELLKKYEKYLKRAWRKCQENLDALVWAPDPFVSMLTEGCTERGMDISDGGAAYNHYGVTSVGMGSTVDTLLNIKKLVYEEGQYSLRELNQYRLENFEKSEEEFAFIKSMNGHYAHDDGDAIQLTNRIIRISNKAAAGYTNPLGGKLKFGLSSPDYIKGAKSMAADLAGRKKGTPYATHISSSDAVYTSTVNFAAQLDYSGHCFNGNVVDFFMTPALIEQNLDKFVLFMKSAIRIGFFQMQMNIVDSKTLIEAKEHPEKYPGLIVRVWGFSAYFKDLPKEYQDQLIHRALVSEGKLEG